MQADDFCPHPPIKENEEMLFKDFTAGGIFPEVKL